MKKYFLLLLLLLITKASYSQFLYTLHDSTTNETNEFIVLPLTNNVPTNCKKLGTVRTSPFKELCYNRQIKYIAQKEKKKEANVIRVTEFLYAHETNAKNEDVSIYAEIYSTNNFEELKQQLIPQTEEDTNYTQLVLFRNNVKVSLFENETYTIEIDSCKYKMELGMWYTIKLPKNKQYTLKFPEFKYECPVTTNTNKMYIQCSLKPIVSGRTHNSISITTGGYFPHILVLNNYIGQLLFGMKDAL